jgi:purine-binding chemotaxis protein CheW
MNTPATDAKPAANDSSSLQCLAFQAGGEVFAIDIRNVREIIQYAGITVVPQMPAFLRGVINLRGAVVPVIDVNGRFCGARSSIGKRSSVIVLNVTAEGTSVALGLLVDAVSEVIAISQQSIEPPPQFGGATPREFILGMGKVGGEFVAIIDPDRALNIEEMALLADQGP